LKCGLGCADIAHLSLLPHCSFWLH
jgi:hypothetical protein